MANIATIPILIPPETITIDVDFYDKDEREALESSSLGSVFKNLPRRITVASQDLCAYYLYYKLRPQVPGFSNHTEIAKKWLQALVEFDGQVGFGESSIYALSLENNSTGTTERLGEAVGLAVAGDLHNLHQADWTRIPRENVKTADFRRVGSDSEHFIELENKGSIVAELSKKASISKHKTSIKGKKAELNANGNDRTVMYGTIAILDDQPDSVAKCLLVDPPASDLHDPRQFKILARIEFIAELVSLLGELSGFAASLQTRLSALMKLPDIMPLNGVPLLKGSGQEYDYEPYRRYYDGHSSWFASKTVVSDGPVGGQLDLVRPDLMFFIGIQEELIEYVARQDFDQIESYEFKSGTLEKLLDCSIPLGRFDREFRPYLNVPAGSARRNRGYVRFQVPANLHYTQSGLVFGTAEVPKQWKR